MQDDFEADTSEGPNPELLAEDDLDEMIEASQAMDYDSDTSNDEPIDCEEEDDERWEDERSEEGEPSQQVDDSDESSEPDAQPRRKRQKCDGVQGSPNSSGE